jgi:hypothetical protein
LEWARFLNKKTVENYFNFGGLHFFDKYQADVPKSGLIIPSE